MTVQVDLCDRQRIEGERRLNQTLIDQSLSVEKALTISHRLKDEIDAITVKIPTEVVKPGEVREFKDRVEGAIA